ncbi:hypothetical protein GPECTOR_14g8 [Gonium pectorale]|uniref:Uncharacterized protein n=1 Tax=Gonium pectorale TaxID=33097 RepID=A0A150GMR0_GONPE|nr:hypothetical protein GPECTOR_14g8 [Gonium pectorale]|eukprot:KXZ51097.1 hypothetical protein GPECTOR_14g8 [Gonium pectorale]
MIPLTFEEAVGYFGVYLFIVAVALSLVVGLYALVIVWTVRGLLALLVLLWVLEGVDAATMLPTLAAPLGYWRVVERRFPFLSATDPLLALSAGTTVWAHIMWTRYHMSTFHHISCVLGFFLVVVWLVPIQILISLAANENVLPGVASGMPREFYAAGGGEGGGARDGDRRGKARRTLLASMFDKLKDGLTGRPKGRTQ